MINRSPDSLTPEEYLALEEKSLEKHEYWHGETYMMAGTSLRHNRIVINLTNALVRLLVQRACSVFNSEIRLGAQMNEVYTYPDIMVICGKIETDPRQQDTVTNPQLIVEVWSDSTVDYDRGEKFKTYRNISSLREYVMIDQSAPYIEYYRRDGHFWVLETVEGLDAHLRLRALECEISFEEIYRQVEWTEQKPQSRKRQRKT